VYRGGRHREAAVRGAVVEAPAAGEGHEPFHEHHVPDLALLLVAQIRAEEAFLRAVEHFATKAAARAKVAAWIEDYNTNRRHSACGMMPPATYEKTLAA